MCTNEYVVDRRWSRGFFFLLLSFVEMSSSFVRFVFGFKDTCLPVCWRLISGVVDSISKSRHTSRNIVAAGAHAILWAPRQHTFSIIKRNENSVFSLHNYYPRHICGRWFFFFFWLLWLFWSLVALRNLASVRRQIVCNIRNSEPLGTCIVIHSYAFLLVTRAAILNAAASAYYEIAS